MLFIKANPATGDRGAQKRTTSWSDGPQNNRHARTSKATPSRGRSACNRASRTPLLSPSLVEALKGLAAVEDLPVPTLIAVLINEALDRRLHRSRS
jgi:hypothetical protein